MKLGDGNTLPGATITGMEHAAKQAIHVYDWSDECSVTDMGSGPTMITVSGITNGTAERIALNGYVEAARLAETELQFPSVVGASEDYYYRVFCSPCRWTPITATLYRYEFTAIAVVPYIYAIATDTRVT